MFLPPARATQSHAGDGEPTALNSHYDDVAAGATCLNPMSSNIFIVHQLGLYLLMGLWFSGWKKVSTMSSTKEIPNRWQSLDPACLIYSQTLAQPWMDTSCCFLLLASQASSTHKVMRRIREHVKVPLAGGVLAKWIREGPILWVTNGNYKLSGFSLERM